MYALQYGFECEKCIDGEHYDYLARLTAKYPRARRPVTDGSKGQLFYSRLVLSYNHLFLSVSRALL